MIPIKHRFSGTTLCEFDVATLREAAEKGSANLYGADLGGADLGGANLYGANLDGANLGGADLGGADLGGKGKLLRNGFFTLGPLGSRNDTLLAFHTDLGMFVRTGCFFDTLDAFRAKVVSHHGADNVHGKTYLAAADLIELKFSTTKE